MESRQVLLALAVLATIVGSLGAPQSTEDMPRPSYARTMLKVSRSLPGETEELKVRTSEGSLATLIVKRREKSLPPSSDVKAELAASSNKSNEAAPTTTTTTAPTTIGYQNVEVDPWNRLQTWSSVSSGSKVEKLEAEKKKEEEAEELRSWIPLSRGLDSWKPVLVTENLDNGRAFQNVQADGGSRDTLLRYAFLPHEPRRAVRTNVGANLHKNRDAKNVPAEVVVRSEINVKPQPGQPQPQRKQPQLRRSPMSLDPDGTPVVHGRRVPDEPIDQIQVWRNARVINDQLVTDNDAPASSTTARGLADLPGTTSFERFFEDVNRRYVKFSDDANPKSRPYRNEVLAAEIYESAEEEPAYRPSIRKRMLQPELGSPSYPNSRLYSPPEPATGAPSVKPGTRAPVLQYAHPELGVQPAKAVAPTRSEKSGRRHEEPTVTEAPMLQQYSAPSAGSHVGEHRHKKKYVLNDKNVLDSYNKNYYPYQQFYGLRRPVVEPPFWVKISENIKSQFSDGVAKVSELTKPVFDPLVEATRKISQNLGLSRTQDHAQDKIGSVATGSSVLIPALGLMASGAALGIGAVAVGRYLDVDVLKRSQNGEVQMQMADDDERALSAVAEMDALRAAGSRPHEDIYVLVQQENPETTSRSKRSSSNFDSRQMQRKGADQIAEIVEIDLPSKALEDTTADEGNDVQLEDEEKLAETIVRQAIEAIASKSKKNHKQSSMTLSTDEESSERRRKRSLSYVDEVDRSDEEELEEALQNLESAELAEASGSSDHVTADWTNTPCAKRIFCEAMVKRGSDVYMFMDKKMYGLLRMIQPAAAVQVSAHFDEVMEAVRRHDCAVFACAQPRMPRQAIAPAPAA